ncbi:MAG: hypothetical protein AAF420_04615 [Pseudomonadota bacterium]
MDMNYQSDPIGMSAVVGHPAPVDEEVRNAVAVVTKGLRAIRVWQSTVAAEIDAANCMRGDKQKALQEYRQQLQSQMLLTPRNYLRR